MKENMLRFARPWRLLLIVAFLCLPVSHVIAAADLWVTDCGIWNNQTEVQHGSWFRAEVSCQANSDVPLSKLFKVEFFLSLKSTLDETALSVRTLERQLGLAPAQWDEWERIDVDNSIPTGNYYLICKIDSGNVIPESNEANNISVSPTRILVSALKPDLVITDMVLNTTTPIQVGSFRVDVTGKNIGAGYAYQQRIYVYLSNNSTISTADRLIGNNTALQLDPGQERVLNILCNLPVDIADGTYYLGAIIDPTNVIEEENESNNTYLYGQVQIQKPQPLPDLAMISVSGWSSTVTEGDTVTVNVTMENKGDGSANGFHIGWYLGTYQYNRNKLAVETSGHSLAAGEQKTVSLTYTYTNGDSVYGAETIVLDNRDEIAEKDEWGKEASHAVTILGNDLTPPDPNPMTWVYREGPRPASMSSITMTATTATDPDGNGVEYYFQETSGNPGATSSGWQDSRTYTDTGLSSSYTYSYRVKARDKSPNRNETAYSVVAHSGVNDAYEPDDDLATQAKTITPGVAQNRTFHNQDDIDNAKFEGVAGRTYRIETYNVSPGWGMGVSLNTITSGSGSTQLHFELNLNGGISFEYTVAETRTYYIRLTQRSGTGSGNYTLKVSDLGESESTRIVDMLNPDEGLFLSKVYYVDGIPYRACAFRAHSTGIHPFSNAFGVNSGSPREFLLSDHSGHLRFYNPSLIEVDPVLTEFRVGRELPDGNLIVESDSYISRRVFNAAISEMIAMHTHTPYEAFSAALPDMEANLRQCVDHLLWYATWPAVTPNYHWPVLGSRAEYLIGSLGDIIDRYGTVSLGGVFAFGTSAHELTEETLGTANYWVGMFEKGLTFPRQLLDATLVPTELFPDGRTSLVGAMGEIEGLISHYKLDRAANILELAELSRKVLTVTLHEGVTLQMLGRIVAESESVHTADPNVRDMLAHYLRLRSDATAQMAHNLITESIHEIAGELESVLFKKFVSASFSHLLAQGLISSSSITVAGSTVSASTAFGLAVGIGYILADITANPSGVYRCQARAYAAIEVMRLLSQIEHSLRNELDGKEDVAEIEALTLVFLRGAQWWSMQQVLLNLDAAYKSTIVDELQDLLPFMSGSNMRGAYSIGQQDMEQYAASWIADQIQYMESRLRAIPDDQDITPPDVIISTPVSDTTTSLPQISFNGTIVNDSDIVVLRVMSSRAGVFYLTPNTTWSAPNVALEPGINVITIEAVDAFDNIGRATRVITYNPPDTEAPVIVVDSPSPSMVATTSVDRVTISGTVTDNDGVSSMSWNTDAGSGQASILGTAFTALNVPLLYGENIVLLRAYDHSGNQGTATVRVDFKPPDTESPSVEIVWPTTEPVFVTDSAFITLAGLAHDNINVVGVEWVNSAGGSGSCDGTSPWLAKNIQLQPGDNVITISAVDAAGNTGNSHLTVIYNPTAATILDLATLLYTADQVSGSTVNDSRGTNHGAIDDNSKLYFAFSDELDRYCLKKEESTTAGLTPSSRPVNSSTFTLSCWAKPTAENDTGSGQFFMIDSSPEKTYRLRTGAINYQYSTHPYPQRTGTFDGDGGWHHYVWVNTDNGDGTARLRMYVDGVKLVDDTLSSSEYSSNVAASQKFLVQRPWSPFYYQFVGEICNIAVFDGLALSDAQVTALYSESDPRPLPDGDASPIVFASNRSGNYDIWRMNPDGSGLMQLTTHEANERSPQWSPDGQLIAFSRGKDLMVMAADGRHQRLITSTDTGVDGIRWAPDGTYLIFAMRTMGDWFAPYHRIDLDGSNMALFETDFGKAASMSFGPSGSSVVWAGHTGNWEPNAEVYIAPIVNNTVATAERTRLTTNSAAEGTPKYSSDFSRILFHRSHAGSGYGDPRNLHVMNADGTSSQQITSFTSPESGYDADYAPGGGRIVFVYQNGGNPDIAILSVAEGHFTNITNTASSDVNPHWRKSHSEALSPNGIPTWWLRLFGIPIDGSMDFARYGESFFTVSQHFYAGTNPTDPSDDLRMTDPPQNMATGFVIRWRSVANRTYRIERSADLTGNPPFISIATGIQGVDGISEYIDETGTGVGPFFYRVVVE